MLSASQVSLQASGAGGFLPPWWTHNEIIAPREAWKGLALRPLCTATMPSQRVQLGSKPIHVKTRPLMGGAEMFSNSYFCNIREIKAKRVKSPIKTHLTSLVSRQSVFACRQVSSLPAGRGRLLGYRQHRARLCSLLSKGFF